MIRINESISVKERDNTPVNSGLYLFYGNIAIAKDNVNDMWFIDVSVLAFENIGYAVKMKYSRGYAISLSEDKIKSRYHFKVTDQELKGNNILKLIDDKIKIELDKIFSPSNVVIV